MTLAPALHVLHLCCTNAFAGVERHVSELAAAQVAMGHRATIVGGDSPRVRAAAGAGVRVLPGHRIDVALRSLRLVESPDVINVHMTAAEVAAAAAAWLRAPIVSTRHFASPRGTRPVTRLVGRWSTRSLNGQIAVSRYVAERIDGASAVVLSGVRPEEGLVPAVDRERTVLVAQRLEREKGTNTAIHAFARSGLQDRGWRLVVAGDGSLRGELEELAATLGLGPSVDFLGHRTDVWELMRSASLLLAPRTDEAFGLSVVEAMARGLPVVAAGSGAHLETVGSVPGAALYRPGDTGHAASVLAALASSESRRDGYATLLQSAQRERFTVDEQARRTEAVYRGFM